MSFQEETISPDRLPASIMRCTRAVHSGSLGRLGIYIYMPSERADRPRAQIAKHRSRLSRPMASDMEYTRSASYRRRYSAMAIVGATTHTSPRSSAALPMQLPKPRSRALYRFKSALQRHARRRYSASSSRRYIDSSRRYSAIHICAMALHTCVCSPGGWRWFAHPHMRDVCTMTLAVHGS